MSLAKTEERTLKTLVKHFVKTIAGYDKGRFLLMMWVGGTGGSLAIGLWQYIYRRRERKRILALAKKKEGQEGSSVQRGKSGSLFVEWKNILKIAFPTFLNEPTFHIVTYTVLLCLRIMLTIKMATLTGTLGKLIGGREWDKMFRMQVIFGLWCFPAALLNALLHFENHNLSLSIREKLVSYVHKIYLADLVYYRVSNLTSHPAQDIDQRISQDIHRFTREITALYGNILKPALEVIFISRALSKLMGFKYLLGFFLYFIVAGAWLRFMMPPFAKLTAETQKLEGEFRTHHNRIISHSEEIAFYGGGTRESTIVSRSFHRVKSLYSKHYLLQCLMSTLDSYVVKYGASMMAYSMLIPAVYLGRKGLASKSTADVMQYYLTSTQLFIALGTACKFLVLSYKQIQSVAGLTRRVSELLGLVHQMKKQTNQISGGKVIEGEEICFEDVDLFAPNGVMLVKGLSFTVKENTNVLVSGPNGSGKSSLFRVLGGLWPLKSGTLVKPKKDELFYVPQNPYLVPGNLRDQVTYPDVLAKDEGRDDDLMELMEAVGLEYLVKREKGWDVEKDWADVLSGGEKQRIAMARLFYHNPKFGILDECTSAVSVDVEGLIYENCKKRGITIFTVSHRPQLMHHHDFMLKFEGEGGRWSWVDLRDTHES